MRDDWRMLDERTEIQPAATELSDIDVVGILPNPSARRVTLRTRFLDIVGHNATLRASALDVSMA